MCNEEGISKVNKQAHQSIALGLGYMWSEEDTKSQDGKARMGLWDKARGTREALGLMTFYILSLD